MNLDFRQKSNQKFNGEQKNIKEILEMIRNPSTSLSNTITEYRDTNNPEIKKALPSFVPGISNNKPTGLVQFDLDKKDNPNLDFFTKALLLSLNPYYLYESPSFGLKFAIMTDFKSNGETIEEIKERYKKLYFKVKEYIYDFFGENSKEVLVFDDNVNSICQQSYLSVDSKAYTNFEVEPLEFNSEIVIDSKKNIHEKKDDLSDDFVLDALALVPKDLRYNERLPFNTAILSHFGIAGIEILMNHWSTGNRTKLKEDLNYQLKHCKENSIGFLIKYFYENKVHSTGRAKKKQKPILLKKRVKEFISNDEIQKQMSDAIEYAIQQKESTLIKATLGSGKTKTTIDIIKNKFPEMKVLYLLKSHELASEIKDQFNVANHIKGKEKTCNNPDRPPDISNSFCKNECPLFNNHCNYIKQFNEDDSVRIMPFNELNISSAFFGDWLPETIVIDEDFISFERDNGHDDLLISEINNELKLINNPNIDDLKVILIKMKLKILSEYDDLFNIYNTEQMKYNINTNPLKYALFKYSRTNDDSILNTIMIKNHCILYIQPKQIQEKYKNIPKIVLDGTGNQELLNKFIPGIILKEFAFNQNEEIKVNQIYNSTVTKTFIKNNKDVFNEGLKKITDSVDGKTGVILFKDCLEEYDEDIISNNLGNIRGSNAFNDVDCLVVQRYRTPPEVLSEYVFALFGERDISLGMKDEFVSIFKKDGEYLISNKVYVNNHMELMSQHFDKSETIQAVHRGRLVYGKEKEIFLLSNESLGEHLIVDEFIDFDDLFKKEKNLIKQEPNSVFENKPKDFLEMGVNKNSWNRDRQQIYDELGKLGYQMKEIHIKNKNYIKSTKEIWFISEQDLDSYILEKGWYID